MQDMNIAWVPVEAVRPFERNPKLHPEKQIKNIAESIRRYGWRSPLLVKLKTGELVAGHGRLLAAKRLGLETVPVLDAQKEQDKAIFGGGFLLSEKAAAEKAAAKKAAAKKAAAEKVNIKWELSDRELAIQKGLG